MIVIGGAHREFCLRPERLALAGPGITGALTQAVLGGDVELSTVIGEADKQELNNVLRTYGVRGQVTISPGTVTFRYATPLSVPEIFPRPDAIPWMPIEVEGSEALVYGMLDARPVVRAQNVVYDPQSAWNPLRYRRDLHGTADRLAYVLNARELRQLRPAQDDVEAARALLQEEGAEVVVVKKGLDGALVVTDTLETSITAFTTGRPGSYLIGSGDVFSAVFARNWFRRNEPALAATMASRSVAAYASTGNVEAIADELPDTPARPWQGRVYLASPFFTFSERWLVEEIRRFFGEFGIHVRSPLHEVGVGDARCIAIADLKLLEECDRVFAICDGRDPGTIFEAGYAAKLGLKTWVVSTSTREADVDKGDLRMLVGSGARVFSDLTEAIVDMATTT